MTYNQDQAKAAKPIAKIIRGLGYVVGASRADRCSWTKTFDFVVDGTFISTHSDRGSAMFDGLTFNQMADHLTEKNQKTLTALADAGYTCYTPVDLKHDIHGLPFYCRPLGGFYCEAGGPYDLPL